MSPITLRYSEPLLREAVRVFWFRAVIRGLGAGFFVAMGVVVAAVALLVWRRDPGWTVPFLLAALLFIVVFIAMIYVAHYRNTLGKFREMRTPEGRLSYTMEEFTLASELGSATMPWSAVTEVWRHPRFWLLLFGRNQFVTLPLECLDEEARAFITRQTAC